MQRTKHSTKVRLHEAPLQNNIMAFSILVNTWITLFCTFFLCHHYEVKVPNVTFYGGRKTSDGETFFSVFLNLDMVLRIIQLQESAPTLEK